MSDPPHRRTGRVQATSTVEAVQEFAHVRARRRGRDDAVDLTRRYAILLAPLLSPDADDLGDGLDLFAEHGEMGAFDAVLAATARNAEASALVSADHGFSVLEAPHVLDPGADGFLERLLELA